jgi:very-short-patch-repair endonuclease
MGTVVLKSLRKTKSSKKVNYKFSHKEIDAVLAKLDNGELEAVRAFIEKVRPPVSEGLKKLATRLSKQNIDKHIPYEDKVLDVFNKLKIYVKPQEPLYYGNNKFYIMDFYVAECRLCIEIDGEYHDTEEQIAYDAKRTKTINNKGINLVRFKNEEVFKEDFPERIYKLVNTYRLVL